MLVWAWAWALFGAAPKEPSEAGRRLGGHLGGGAWGVPGLEIGTTKVATKEQGLDGAHGRAEGLAGRAAETAAQV